MGNCFQKKEEALPEKEMQSGVKSDITVMTFAGPQPNFESIQQDVPPTFSDPNIFQSSKQTLTLMSISKDD